MNESNNNNIVMIDESFAKLMREILCENDISHNRPKSDLSQLLYDMTRETPDCNTTTTIKDVTLDHILSCFEKYPDQKDAILLLETCDVRTFYTPLTFFVDQWLTILDDDEEETLLTQPTFKQNKIEEIPMYAILQFMLKKGANPNVGKIDGNAGDAAAAQRNEQEYLINAPLHRICKFLSSSSKSQTSSTNAKHSGTQTNSFSWNDVLEKAISLLFQYGAIVSPETKQLLHNIVRKNNLRLTRFFIECLHVDPNLPGRQGLTPLHFASRSGHTHIVSWILSNCGPQGNIAQYDSNYCINIDATDDRGMKAIDYARVNKWQDIIDLLDTYSHKST
eukprot:CAMPEP_0184865150 /NCGR_PEP_ID=MMETSP0580-20130426/17114_1 /TAXON_ID=1118495 /ORGANISM="Dactyliosolen fragilissimus" /LENGTH=334 /DNA_ID=CAMNT_0027364231 /DNA_START=605 /DNA_END=1609 /DNA_ORIENTATION=-